jgi:hypothetical protein
MIQFINNFKIKKIKKMEIINLFDDENDFFNLY